MRSRMGSGSGVRQDGQLLGVMGLQDVEDVTLIRHAYVRTTHRRRGIGGRLLNDLRSKATRPLYLARRIQLACHDEDGATLGVAAKIMRTIFASLSTTDSFARPRTS